MGTVYAAEEFSTGRHVALKMLSLEDVPDPERLERFRREGRLAAAVQHPRCVFVFGADEVDGVPFISMEEMRGTTLRDVVEEQGSMPVHQAVDAILHVIEGLEAASAQGVLHRDVKPSNCFIDIDGSIKVGDFGLSKSLELGENTDLTLSGAFVGTPHYASPEQVRGLLLDHRSDQYAVGATLYYLLTGQPPHPGTHVGQVLTDIASSRPDALRALRPDLPRSLERVVLRVLAKDPAHRYRGFTALRAALVPYSSRGVSRVDVGLRVVAFCFDLLLVVGLGVILGRTLLTYATGATRAVQHFGFWVPVGFAYFGLTECLTGRSPGKALLGLVVTRADDMPVGFPRCLFRLVCGCVIAQGLAWVVFESTRGEDFSFEFALLPLSYGFEDLGWLLGALVAASTMRRGNGFQGLQDVISGTRVSGTRVVSAFLMTPGAATGTEQSAPLPGGRLPSLGPYRLTGSVFPISGGDLFAAEDQHLGRPVWVHLRPSSAEPPARARRELRRPPRLRWLDGGTSDGRRWDAYEAPDGVPTDAAVATRGALPWSEARWYLLDLVRELAASSRDGTLPATLSTSQVRLVRGGRIRLLDWAAPPQDGPADAVGPLGFVTCLARRLLAPTSPAGVTDFDALPRDELPSRATALLERCSRATDDGGQLDVTATTLAGLTRDEASLGRRLRMATLLPFALVVLAWAPQLTPWLHTTALHGPPSGTHVALWIADDRDAPLTAEIGWTGSEHVFEDVATVLTTHGRDELPLDGLAADDIVSVRDPFGGTHALPGRRVLELVELAARHLVDREPSDQAAGEARKRLLFGSMVSVPRAYSQGLRSVLVTLCLCALASALLFRGGLLLSLLGVRVHVRGRGRASRLRCTLRTAIAWLVPTLLAVQAQRLQIGSFRWADLPTLGMDPQLTAQLMLAALITMAIGGAWALWKPGRGLHDRVAGTVLVPR
jgi:hypothetical protein